MKQTIIPIFLTVALLAACGDDGSSTSANKGGTDFAFEEETLDDLPNCTAEYEQSTAFIKDGKKIYVCDAGRWEYLRAVIDSVGTLDELSACTNAREGDSVLVISWNAVYVCDDGKWKKSYGIILTAESSADFPACTDSRDGDKAYAVSERTYYICDDGKWEFSSRLRDSVSAENDLPNCTEKIDGDSAYVNADNTVRLCRSERWLVLGESVANRDSLKNCTSTREGAWVFLENEGATLVCSDGKWTPFDVKDLEPESSSSVSPGSSSSEETSSSSLVIEASSSSAVEFSSSSAVLESSSSVVESSSSSSVSSSSAASSSSAVIESSSSVGKSSSSSLASSSSAVSRPCSVSSGDILCGNGMFSSNGTAVGMGWSLQAYKEDMEADQSADYDSSAFGVVSVISNDDGASVLEFKPSVISSFADLWKLQAFYDGITLEKGFSYKIQVNGYKYVNSRTAYLGVYVPSTGTAPLTFDFTLYGTTGDRTESSDSYTHCGATVPARLYIGLIGPNEPYDDMPDEDWEYGFAIRWVKLIKTAASCY